MRGIYLFGAMAKIRLQDQIGYIYISLGKVSVRKEKQASDRGRYLYLFSISESSHPTTMQR